MPNLRRKLETCANVAIIVLAIAAGAVLVKSYFWPQPPEPEHLRGKKVLLQGEDWAKNGQTLLLVLQQGCRFCSESAPFYQRLAREENEHRATRLIAVLPQDVNTSRQYLSELGVHIEEVRQVQAASLGIRGTPTLLLVNDEGVVTESWVGRLSADEEAEVIERLRVQR
jgi:thioredoxin-related protein